MSTVPSAATVSRLEKVAVDNGFDRELGREGGWLCFASSQASVRLWLTTADDLIYLAALSMAHVVAGLGEFGDRSRRHFLRARSAVASLSGFPNYITSCAVRFN